MRLLINGLSARALSGWYVLRGHLHELAKQHSIQTLLLYDSTQRDALAPFPSSIQQIEITKDLSQWPVRYRWEKRHLPERVRRTRADVVLNMSGTITGHLGVPEFSMGLNPWCMATEIPKSVSEHIKAAIQRRAYRKAIRSADQMFFCSGHLRTLYRNNNPGGKECSTNIALIGLGPEILEAAKFHRETTTKIPGLIVSVSAMAPWKGTERLIKAFQNVRATVPTARLRLVGPWPHAAYECKIRQQIADSPLPSDIEITGSVSQSELYRHYAEASVYALVSKAESFGIPALEAQAFGTPILGALDCAMPEIGGEGGVFVDPDNIHSISEHLIKLLTDKTEYQTRSTAALQNIERFLWKNCSAPIIQACLAVSSNSRHADASPNGSVIAEPQTITE